MVPPPYSIFAHETLSDADATSPMTASAASAAPVHFTTAPIDSSKARMPAAIENVCSFGNHQHKSIHARSRYPVLNIHRTSTRHAAKKSRIMLALKVTLTSAMS